MIKEDRSIFGSGMQRMLHVPIPDDLAGRCWIVALGSPSTTAVNIVVTASEEHRCSSEALLSELAKDDLPLAQDAVKAMADDGFATALAAKFAGKARLAAKEAVLNRFNPSFVKAIKFGNSEVADDFAAGLRRCVGL